MGLGGGLGERFGIGLRWVELLVVWLGSGFVCPNPIITKPQRGNNKKPCGVGSGKWQYYTLARNCSGYLHIF